MSCRFVKNVSWILFGNVLHAILQFLLSVFAARSFSENDFGLLNYGASLVTFFTAVSLLGFDGIITKKFADDEAEAGSYLGTAMLARVVVAIVSVVIIQTITGVLHANEPVLNKLVFCQSLAIVASCGDSIIYWYRYKSKANIVAIIRLVALGISAIIRVAAICFWKSINIYAIGVTVETVSMSVVLLVIFARQYSSKYALHFDAGKLRAMLAVSYPFISSAILSTIYSQTDKVMLKGMMDNTAVAIYSVALTITSISSIIPRALIEGFRPEIMIYKKTNEVMYQRRMCQLYAIVFWMCIAFGLLVTAFSEWIVLLLYGDKYLPAADVLSVIVWFTSFSYFGAINNLYYVAENKNKWVQITTLVGAIGNVVLNLLLIPLWGTIGAAFASLITQFIANVFMQLLIPSLRSNFTMMLRGITFQGVFLGGDRSCAKQVLKGRKKKKKDGEIICLHFPEQP